MRCAGEGAGLSDAAAALPVIGMDPGPLARLEAVKLDQSTPSVVFQRVCDGETLREIAKAWGLPKGPFIQWFTTEHAALYDSALKVKADELAHEALAISDEQAAVEKKDGGTYDPDVARDKLRVDTRLRLAEKFDRTRYGNKDSGPAGGVTVIVNRAVGSDPVPVVVDGNTLTVETI